jgi:hypothetical protein
MLYNANYNSLLVFLGPESALQELDRPDFLHPRFFIHCTTREDYTYILGTHAGAADKIDIFLPDTAVDLIHNYGIEAGQRRRFNLYCETDVLVNQYRRLTQTDPCDQVFNANQLETKLYKAAHRHLLRCITDLEKRSEAGDIDADDPLTVIGDLFEQSAVKINEAIRQKSVLPQQPAEQEEG